MKRLYQLPRMRQANQRHAERSAAQHLRSKLRRRRERRLAHRIPRAIAGQLLDLEAQLGYVKMTAPPVFSFLENPDGVIAYIAGLEEQFNKRAKVFVVLKDVEHFDYAAIVVLLAIMVRFKSHGVDFNGNVPKAEGPRSLIMRSGFFSNLGKTYDIAARYHISEDDTHRIHTHAWKNVDAKLGDDIITRSSQKVWGEKRRCPGVQTTLIELMQNTNNHAEIGKQGEKHWWLSVYHPKDERRVCFSFIDFGVGVFTSLANKPADSKFYNWAAKLAARVKYGDNADVLRLILAGELHQTASKKSYRGKGLPGIAELTRQNELSALHIVTNNVYCSYDKEAYRILNTSFNGTLVTWEITQENGSLPYD